MKPQPKLSPYASGSVSSAGHDGRPRLRSRKAMPSGIPTTYAVRKTRLASSSGNSQLSALTR
ncbi:hypothetical protein [Corallococcus sp. 4LFB]|uniref:hypothetical protein n=1 Tax=Corallococcus sp. 4LFB TaxID=3383249 RepID=UPI0039765940